MRYKLFTDKTVHRFSLEDSSLSALRSRIASYGINLNNSTIEYKDDEGDFCQVSSQEEWKEALSIFASVVNPVLKIRVVSKPQPAPQKNTSCPFESLVQSSGDAVLDITRICKEYMQSGKVPEELLSLVHRFKDIKLHLVDDDTPEKEASEDAHVPSPPQYGAPHYHHPLYRCDSCDDAIFGERYHCSECPDYDLCSKCWNMQPRCHPLHYVFDHISADGVSHPVVLPKPKEESKVAPPHNNFLCDKCETRITGSRFHCAQCLDYDLCENCSKQKHLAHAQHDQFIHFSSPSSSGVPIILKNPEQSVEEQAPPQEEEKEEEEKEEEKKEEEKEEENAHVLLLRGMGFTQSTSVLNSLLKKHKNDLRKVVDDLLDAY